MKKEAYFHHFEVPKPLFGSDKYLSQTRESICLFLENEDYQNLILYMEDFDISFLRNYKSPRGGIAAKWQAELFPLVIPLLIDRISREAVKDTVNWKEVENFLEYFHRLRRLAPKYYGSIDRIIRGSYYFDSGFFTDRTQKSFAEPLEKLAERLGKKEILPDSSQGRNLIIRTLLEGIIDNSGGLWDYEEQLRRGIPSGKIDFSLDLLEAVKHLAKSLEPGKPEPRPSTATRMFFSAESSAPAEKPVMQTKILRADAGRSTVGEAEYKSGDSIETFGETFEVLGVYRGGTGFVYRVRNSIGRECALKKIGPSQSTSNLTVLTEQIRIVTAAFQQMPRRVTNLHVQKVYCIRVGKKENTRYWEQEWIEGESWLAKLEKGRLDLQTNLVIAKQIVQVLAEAAKQQLVHCDVKPANIIIADDGVTAVLGDWYSARRVNSKGELSITPSYAPPVLTKDFRIDSLLDSYCWGATAYHALTGETQILNSLGLPMVEKEINIRFPRIERISEPLRQIVANCLALNPRDRLSALDISQKLDSM